jgi:hypothetical protein
VEEIELGVQCQSDAADELASALSGATGAPVEQLELDNLDGSPTLVLEVVKVAASLISVVAPIVTAYIGSKRVKKIKLGSIEIENPTREQWESVWKQYVSHESTRASRLE